MTANETKSQTAEEDEENITKSLAHLAIGDQIKTLTKRLQDCNEELHQQVRENYGALLQQATHAGRFDYALNTLTEDVERIQTTGKNLKGQVDGVYKLLENQTKLLARLQTTSHLLRSAGTLQKLTIKFKATKDVPRQAEILYELGELIDDSNLKNIDFIQNDRTFLITSRQKIRNLTQMQLVVGLHERNETQVINALKVFVNFRTLDTCLDNLVITYISDLEQSLKECFAGNDISLLTNKLDTKKQINNASHTSSGTLRGPGKPPQLTTTQNFRAKFWKSLHWLIYDELFESCEQIKFLKQCLEQINQFDYTTENVDSLSIQQNFWNAVQSLFREAFADSPQHVFQTLEEGLSKLLSSAKGLENRLSKQFLFDNEIFAPLEAGYLSKCGANLKACLAGVDLPSNETVDNFIKTAATELSASLIGQQLASSVTAVFIACSRDLCTKLESQIRLGADTKQVVDMPNLQQQQNTLLANILFYFKDSVKRMLLDLQGHFEKTYKSVSNDISKSLEQADLLITTILQQLVDSIISTIGIILVSVHREPGLNTDRISVAGPSMYMKELQEFILRCWSNHIELFDDKEITRNCGKELAKRTINLFIHNICIARPISKAGRQRLKNDCIYLEQALKPLCQNIHELGNLSRLLRALSVLFVQAPSDLVKQSIGKDSLVPSYIVLLILFGYASSELQSPHTTLNWSNERLIEWLEGHTSEHEKLELISGALQRYRDNVRRKKSQQYDEIYPLMVDFFEKAVKENS